MISKSKNKLIHLSHRLWATYKNKNLHTLSNKSPLISFTFDDFPKSAALKGAEILRKYHIKGTFYISFGIIGQDSPVGEICNLDTIKNLIEEKHEIGNHTFNHINAYECKPEVYEKSLIENERYYKEYFSVSEGFQNFSYPLGLVTAEVKQITQKYFRCSRTVYNGINSGKVDLNMLKSYPIFGNGEDLSLLKNVINHNKKKNGWLIFFTHDVTNNPSKFGCTPEYFEEVVKYSLDSGSELVTVAQACDIISASYNTKFKKE